MAKLSLQSSFISNLENPEKSRIRTIYWAENVQQCDFNASSCELTLQEMRPVIHLQQIQIICKFKELAAARVTSTHFPRFQAVRFCMYFTFSKGYFRQTLLLLYWWEGASIESVIVH